MSGLVRNYLFLLWLQAAIFFFFLQVLIINVFSKMCLNKYSLTGQMFLVQRKNKRTKTLLEKDFWCSHQRVGRTWKNVFTVLNPLCFFRRRLIRSTTFVRRRSPGLWNTSSSCLFQMTAGTWGGSPASSRPPPPPPPMSLSRSSTSAEASLWWKISCSWVSGSPRERRCGLQWAKVSCHEDQQQSRAATDLYRRS